MIGTIARGFVGFRSGLSGADVPATATASGARRPTLLDRYGDWLRRREDAARLRERDDPRAARDMGVLAYHGAGGAPSGFAVDPRPLWGIGLTPQPMDVAPHWSARRCRG